MLIELANSSRHHLQVGKVGKRSAPPLKRSVINVSFLQDYVRWRLHCLRVLIASDKTLRLSGGALRLPTFPTCELPQLEWLSQSLSAFNQRNLRIVLALGETMHISFSPNLRRRSTFILITMTVAVIAVVAVVSNGHQRAAAKSFTVEQIKSYPFPTELTAASTGS